MENIWRREIYFLWRRKNGEGKGGKYLKKENVTIAGRTRFSIPHICHFFTQPQFEAKKFYTWKCINSRHKLSRDKTVCRILLFVFDQLFRVPIGKIFTWLNLFTQPGVVMFVTNIRCGSQPSSSIGLCVWLLNRSWFRSAGNFTVGRYYRRPFWSFLSIPTPRFDQLLMGNI